jgi:hypothetical protein
MMAVYACVALALFIIALLFFAGRVREAGEDVQFDGQQDCRKEVLCPPGIVERIFSKQDRRFIREFDSPRLRRIYSKERRQIARHWICQTSAGIRTIMRDHLRSARASHNLELSGELSLLSNYVQLRCLCGMLVLGTLVVSPGFLQEVAVYASNLSQQMKSARERMDGALQLPSADGNAAI